MEYKCCKMEYLSKYNINPLKNIQLQIYSTLLLHISINNGNVITPTNNITNQLSLLLKPHKTESFLK